MKINYFVSFRYRLSKKGKVIEGSTHNQRGSEIETFKDIRDLEEEIVKSINAESVIISNFIRLKDTDK